MTFPGILCGKSSLLFSLLAIFPLCFTVSAAAPFVSFSIECSPLAILCCVEYALVPAPSSSNTPNLQEQLTSDRGCTSVFVHASSCSGASSGSEATLELHSSPCGTENPLPAARFHSRPPFNPHSHSSDGRLGIPRVPRPGAATPHPGSGEEGSESGFTPSDPSSKEESSHQPSGRRHLRCSKSKKLDLRSVSRERPLVGIYCVRIHRAAFHID